MILLSLPSRLRLRFLLLGVGSALAFLLLAIGHQGGARRAVFAADGVRGEGVPALGVDTIL